MDILLFILITYIKQIRMEKINLSVQRSFSDLITTTINFMKQEFVPFIRAFAIIGFPMILIMLFFMKDLLMEVFNMSLQPEAYYSVDDFGDTMLRTLFTSLFGVLMMLWVQLFSISYLRVYWDHYRAGIEERITVGEVFKVMMKKLGIYLVWSVFYGLIVCIGSLFLFVPGIYFGIAFSFGTYLLILRDNGLGKSITESMTMIKGNWWKTFGYIIVLYLLVGVVAYLFGIPYLFVMMSTAFTGELPNIYEITFSLLFSYLGQYTLYTVLFVGIGMLFFSRSEEMEHTTLLNRINQLGGEPEKKVDGEID